MVPGFFPAWLLIGAIFALEEPSKALFVVDGAGGFFTCSNSYLRGTAAVAPDVDVIPFLWSHGFRRYLADQMDTEYAQKKGLELASQIMNWKNAHPGGRVWLLGHSAGCHVALHAAGAMPPDTIEKMALLVPSCSTKADIAGALRASRLGVHVWYSEADWLILGIVMKVSGCGDDYSTSKAAGRFGFQPIPKSPDEIDLMRRRLRQYPWHQVHSTLGHNGGHYGVYRSQFSQVIVLPILFSPVVD